MTNSFKTIILAFITILTTSCLKQTESITPLAPVRTLAEIQRETMISTAMMAAGNTKISKNSQVTLEENTQDSSLFYLNLKFNITDLDLYEKANIPNSFEQIGNSFLKILAKIFFVFNDSRTVKIGKINFELPDLNLDFDIVRTIKVKRIFIEYNKEFNESVDNKANFSFINSLDIARTSGASPLLFSYKKSQNKCNQKCLDFTIVNGNVFNLLKDSVIVPILPTLTISAMPKITDLRIDGQIELQIGLKLPF